MKKLWVVFAFAAVVGIGGVAVVKYNHAVPTVRATDNGTELVCGTVTFPCVGTSGPTTGG